MRPSYPVKVFATRGSADLADSVYDELRKRLPEEYQPTRGASEVFLFANQNMMAKIADASGSFVVVIHTQRPPVSEGLIELLLLLDAIKNARPADVLLVFPYMPYSRSDLKNQPGISTFGCSLPAIITKVFGVKRVLLLDPHDSHTMHAFDPVADGIRATILLCAHIEKHILIPELREKSVVVFPDAGSAKRYAEVPRLLGLPEAYISKERLDNSGKSKHKKVVGPIEGSTCFMIDDEILTGGTVVDGAESLIKAGAKDIYMVAVHPILERIDPPSAIELLENSPALKGIIVTDSVPVLHKLGGRTKFTVVSIVNLLAEAIARTVLGNSITELHQQESVESLQLYR